MLLCRQIELFYIIIAVNNFVVVFKQIFKKSKQLCCTLLCSISCYSGCCKEAYEYITWSTIAGVKVHEGRQWSVEGDGCQLASQELHSESCKS